MNHSPYLLHQGRLADVIAAIQVLGSHLWDSREIKDWKENIGEKPLSANEWEAVFMDHPEFFGKDISDGREYHFLRLRRAYEQTVDTKTQRELSEQELAHYKAHDSYSPNNLARRVLTPNQIEALIKAAVELHVRAAAFQDRKRWWWIPLLSAALSFLGALSGAWLKGIHHLPPPTAQNLHQTKSTKRASTTPMPSSNDTRPEDTLQKGAPKR
jgi:hypothetical protein